MLVNSWNEKGYTKLYTTTNDTGYLIGTNIDEMTTSIDSQIGNNNIIDVLYNPNKEEDYGECDAYWLSSPSAKDSNRLMCLDIGEFNIGGGTCNDSSVGSYGLRPVVCLESDTIGTIGDSIIID